MADEQDQIRRTLDEHWFYDDTDTCTCGYWAHFDSVRRHHIEDMLVAALKSLEDRVLALVEGDAALIRMARNDALRRAADALEAQPPKLKAQYVAALRLYADEPERLGLAASPRARPIRCASCASPLPDDGECRACDDDSDDLTNPPASETSGEA